MVPAASTSSCPESAVPGSAGGHWGPSPWSRWLFVTVAFGHRSGLAWRSSTSETSRIILQAICQMFSRLIALTGTHHRVAAPVLQRRSAWLGASCIDPLGAGRPSLSILLDREHDRQLRRAAWGLIASRVWWANAVIGRHQPSTAHSVTFGATAPHAVNASVAVG